MNKKGFFTLILSGILYSFVGILARFLLPLNGVQISCLAGIIIFLVFLVITIYKKKFNEVKLKTNKKYLLLISICNAFSVGLFFWAVQIAKISEVTFIFYMASLWVLVFSLIFLKEKINKFSIIAFLFGVFGLILIIKPFEVSSINIGHILVLGGSLFYSTVYIFRKKIGKTYSDFSIMFWCHLALAVIFLPSLFFLPEISFGTINIIVLFSAVTLFSRFLFFKGVGLVKAHVSSVIMLLEPAGATVFGYLILSEVPGILSSIGILFILLSLIIIYTKKKVV